MGLVLLSVSFPHAENDDEDEYDNKRQAEQNYDQVDPPSESRGRDRAGVHYNQI